MADNRSIISSPLKRNKVAENIKNSLIKAAGVCDSPDWSSTGHFPSNFRQSSDSLNIDSSSSGFQSDSSSSIEEGFKSPGPNNMKQNFKSSTPSVYSTRVKLGLRNSESEDSEGISSSDETISSVNSTTSSIRKSEFSDSSGFISASSDTDSVAECGTKINGKIVGGTKKFYHSPKTHCVPCFRVKAPAPELLPLPPAHWQQNSSSYHPALKQPLVLDAAEIEVTLKLKALLKIPM